MELSIHNAGSNTNNSQKEGDGGSKQNEFNLDKQEYLQVFKIFDKDNTGVINIDQVYELINKFEDTTLNTGGTNLNMNQHGNSGNSGAHGTGSGFHR